MARAVELRDRRVAQIVRDFMQAYALSLEVGERLRDGALEFEAVDRLVSEQGESALHRLKEECHALFRRNGPQSPSELQAEELFDLALGALFHEGMKFREGYYLTTAYGPRFERMMHEGSASGMLGDSFRRLFEAGRRRMLESQAAMAEMFRETRDQLLILLRRLTQSGAVARSLVEDPQLTELVFGCDVPALLEQVYGSSLDGYRLAVSHLVRNGHYEETLKLLDRTDMRRIHYCRVAGEFSQGMASYYAGDPAAALESLERWIKGGAVGGVEEDGAWRDRARSVLEAVAEDCDGLDPALVARSRELLGSLRQASLA
jgi:hypothetical protein